MCTNYNGLNAVLLPTLFAHTHVLAMVFRACPHWVRSWLDPATSTSTRRPYKRSPKWNTSYRADKQITWVSCSVGGTRFLTKKAITWSPPSASTYAWSDSATHNCTMARFTWTQLSWTNSHLYRDEWTHLRWRSILPCKQLSQAHHK